MLPELLQFTALAFLSLSASAARYPSFGTLQTTNLSGVLNVVINNTFSSINLFDFYVQADLASLIETLQTNDTDVRVVIFSSANPEFFLAHVDINALLPGYSTSVIHRNSRTYNHRSWCLTPTCQICSSPSPSPGISRSSHRQQSPSWSVSVLPNLLSNQNDD